MSDMVERAARAIRDARAFPGTKPVPRISEVDRRAAFSVIAAMREPTPGMIAEGVSVLGMPWFGVMPPDADHDEYVLGMVFSAMIDAALEETGE